MFTTQKIIPTKVVFGLRRLNVDNEVTGIESAIRVKRIRILACSQTWFLLVLTHRLNMVKFKFGLSLIKGTGIRLLGINLKIN